MKPDSQSPSSLAATSTPTPRSSGWYPASVRPASVPEPLDLPSLETRIEVIYPTERGPIGLRGSHLPLSWEHTEHPTRVEGDTHLFRISLHEGELLELKVVRGEDWASGRNYVVHAGDHLRIEPYFETEPSFEHHTIDHDGIAVDVDVLLPPSYAEQKSKRYPVLYVLDGQSLWTHSTDAFGVWQLDATLSSLYELGAIEELIVVGVHTSTTRLDLLSPVPDPTYGGGKGEAFLERLVTEIRPLIDGQYRSLTDRASTGILGSSMGGLFAFYAAFTRPDIFGRAACLSSSFWWANRWAIRLVQSGALPEPRPFLYLDSGASPAPLEEDARVLDGFHHTRSMHRALSAAGFDIGAEVHRLVFPGQLHHAASWASRVSLPLQLLFPRTQPPIDEERWARLTAAG